MKKVIFSLLAIGAVSMASAYHNFSHAPESDGSGDRPVSSMGDRAAGCDPAVGKLFMNFNNVNALIETAGFLWTDRAAGNNGLASYEVPKGSENHVLYAGALWMGGTDINGQLKLAAHRFRQANDFWAGPLGDLIEGSGNYNPFVPQNAELTLFRDFGAAEVFPVTCVEYDKFFTIRKGEVLQFIAWWNCENGVTDPADCADVERPNDEIMDRIINWPAHGNTSIGQDLYLAPFYDNARPGESPSGFYDPIGEGDYPWYDINEEVDCRNDRRVTLFGDETHWWVFNDKGNIHTESGGDPIGMEIRAQAFAFATDDAINDMTFYNYELINRGTQTLFDTYFAQYVDPDVGDATNDLVGCDVQRGLGFCYNGEATDNGQGAQPGYGTNPPAVGVDFFEGPYQDNDGVDNAIGILDGEALNGIGYGDGVVDNERYGMRRFVFYNNSAGPNGDPQSATDYYRYMQGIWRNGQRMVFGGDGFSTGGTVEADFMFPDNTDPLNWGTGGIDPGDFDWNEITAGNAPADRRFVQSAGPFRLVPGAVNNITVGVVYGRSNETDLEASVRSMKTADTKAQALFDNCFELVEPPAAPFLNIQELENELILYITPTFDENEWFERDRINIITPDSILAADGPYNDTFRFEGYQIFQMKDENATITQLDDIEFARLVAQCDRKNGVDKLVNYTYNEELDISIPAVMVNGEDEGIRHSFKITEDLFATGERTLVNHKKYYYIAVAYAYNNYKDYDPDDATLLDGQKRPYLRSRISATGQGIESVLGIPHDPSPEADGTIYTTSYGFQPEITQVEGIGNGGAFLELNDATVQSILDNGQNLQPTYKSGFGPVDVKVIDPLNLKEGEYTLKFLDSTAEFNDNQWVLERNFGGVIETVVSDFTIAEANEQLILDWGLSVTINQVNYIKTSSSNNDRFKFTEPIDATITFADSSKQWLTGVSDGDGYYPTNWIRSGAAAEQTAGDGGDPAATCDVELWINNPCFYDDDPRFDSESALYEGLLEGTVAPFRLCGYGSYGMPFGFPGENPNTAWYEGGDASAALRESEITGAYAENHFITLHDVDIVITSDETKWTRCPVIEINNNENQTEHGDDIWELRSDNSVDKTGAEDGSGTGMGWFPGYAIDVNTGQRLNMMFSENSWLTGENGNDMIWNPTSRFVDNTGNPLLGGMHYVYVFGVNNDDTGCPIYDEGAWLREKLEDDGKSNGDRREDYEAVLKNCQWVMAPMLEQNMDLLETDVKVGLRINKEYRPREVDLSNNTFPMYRFTIDNPTITGDESKLVSVIDNINVVPNPYYAYSTYEGDKTENVVKFTNLPERCEITIFNMQGALVRNFVKDDPMTSLDWDLENHQGVPIAGGVYIIHVKFTHPSNPDQEYEKILKWFGVLRQADLDNI